MAEYMEAINPAIIKWARERSGYTLKDIAKSFKKDITTISYWESGEKAPTYRQLEKLADKFKRPTALFFFPEIPRFFRVKCGNETCYRKTRLPYEFKLIAIIPNMVLEPPQSMRF